MVACSGWGVTMTRDVRLDLGQQRAVVLVESAAHRLRLRPASLDIGITGGNHLDAFRHLGGPVHEPVNRSARADHGETQRV